MKSNVKIKQLEENYFKITVEGNEFDMFPIDEILDENEEPLYSIWIKNNEYEIIEKLSEKEVITRLIKNKK